MLNSTNELQYIMIYMIVSLALLIDVSGGVIHRYIQKTHNNQFSLYSIFCNFSILTVTRNGRRRRSSKFYFKNDIDYIIYIFVANTLGNDNICRRTTGSCSIKSWWKSLCKKLGRNCSVLFEDGFLIHYKLFNMARIERTYVIICGLY